ncbi:alpha/beta hydrolase [Acinetobacter sp. NEB149]|uniref:alpha/beta hydrolase n=1 Tax=Acinetobacter TaxID=469 RepID=UPI00110C9DB0|nr:MULTISPECIES: alpha/beta hydrolase [Acinetobacter]QJB48149.1 alpha/beta hydrolase [Acinetobacter sp. NEB149]TMS53239.1 alpha/beta hydrolase [Acinetobacter lwoffii]
MKVIFIHGMNQQHHSAASIRQRWLHILQKGIRKHRHDARFSYLRRHIHIPFYGDLLSHYNVRNILNAGTLMPQQWPSFRFRQPIHPQLPAPVPRPGWRKPVISDLPQLHLNDPMDFKQKFKFITTLSKNVALRDFVLLLNYFPSLHRSLLQKFLIETYLYLDNPAFMKEVHERIARQLNGRKPCIVIAHSLGSVIAYNYLIQHPELNIQRFITLGSPLAFQVIQSHLPQPIVRPTAITGDWINFYSTDDFLTAFPLTQPPFQFQPAIINHGIRTHIHCPHDITGYLLHPQVVEAILELLKNPA